MEFLDGTLELRQYTGFLPRVSLWVLPRFGRSSEVCQRSIVTSCNLLNWKGNFGKLTGKTRPAGKALEPAFEGNGLWEVRLVSPAEGTGALAPVWVLISCIVHMHE